MNSDATFKLYVSILTELYEARSSRALVTNDQEYAITCRLCELWELLDEHERETITQMTKMYKKALLVDDDRDWMR